MVLTIVIAAMVAMRMLKIMNEESDTVMMMMTIEDDDDKYDRNVDDKDGDNDDKDMRMQF